MVKGANPNPNNVTYALRTVITRYSGIFDFDGLQHVMVQWLKARRFWFHESTYKHMPGTEFGREEEIYWVAQRNVDSYVQYNIEIYFHLFDINMAEVIHEGEKKKLTKARMEIWFSGKVVFDYQGHWDKSKFHRILRGIYNKYILIPEGILSSIYWDELYYRMLKLQDLTKDYLNMKTKGNEYRRYLRDNI